MDILLVVAAILVQLLCSSGAPIYGWGANNKGQLGIGNTISPMYDIQKIPFYANSSLSPMKHIFVGPEYHLIELQNSEFYGSGDNSFNQLPANDSSIQFDSPAQLVDIPPYDYILPSGTFGLAFNDTSGELYGWGLAGGFLLGTSSGNYTPVPIAREFQFYGQGAVARAAVAHNAVFVTLANGTTWVAGTTPQVTLNGVTNGFVRMPFWDMVPLRSVFSTTSTSVCALSVNSSLFCWGDNDRGQLGLGHTNLVQSPQRVQYFDDYGYVLYQLQQGESHSIALTCDGKVFAWGQNQCGQLGIGSNASFVATPTEVQSLRGANIVEIISSARSVFARSAQNKWYAWGDIQSLGMNNTHTNLTTPVIHPLLEQLQITQLFSSSHANYFLGWNGVSTTTSRSKGCPATVAVCQNTTCDANAVCTNRQNVGPNCTCNAGYYGDGIKTTNGGSGCKRSVCGNQIVEPGEYCDEPSNPCCRNCLFVADNTPCTPAPNTSCYAESQCMQNKCVGKVFNRTMCDDPLDRCCNTCEFASDGYPCLPIPSSNTSCFTTYQCKAKLCDGDEIKFCSAAFSECKLGQCACKTQLEAEYCGNGICDKNENCSVCPADCGPCIPCNDIYCANGKCVESVAQCDVPCSNTAYFRCLNDTCVEDFKSCNMQKCTEFVCWNGGCVSDVRACPLIPSCPESTRRCGSTCVPATTNCAAQEQCGLVGGVSCLNGDCACVCEPYDGCAHGLVLCSNGTCVPDLSYCSNESASLGEKPIVFAKKISITEDAEVRVVSRTGKSLASMFIPTGTFVEDTTLRVGSVPDDVVLNIPKPVTWGNSSIVDNILSSVIEFSLSTIQPFQQPVTITLAINQGNISELCLAYITNDGTWECASDLTSTSEGYVVGTTNHFTPYAVVKKVHFPVINDLGDTDAFKNINKNNIIIYIYVGLVVVFGVAFYWAINADKKYKTSAIDDNLDGAKLKNIELQSIPAQSPTFSTSTVGSNSSAYSNEDWADAPIDIKQVKSSSVKLQMKRKMRKRASTVKKVAETHFREKHKWLSIYFMPRISALSRTARVMILLCMVLSNMTISSAFYNSANRDTIAQQIVTAIVSSVISFFICFTIFIIFSKTPKRFNYLAYGFGILFCIGTAFVTFWYNISFERDRATHWCISTTIGVIQDGIINEPLKIFVLSLLVGCFRNIPVN